jgi:hypothetical protein
MVFVMCMVLLVLLMFGYYRQSMMDCLSGLVLLLDLGLQFAMLGELLIVLRVCAVDNGGGIALLHHGILCLRGVLLILVHNEA